MASWDDIAKELNKAAEIFEDVKETFDGVSATYQRTIDAAERIKEATNDHRNEG